MSITRFTGNQMDVVVDGKDGIQKNLGNGLTEQPRLGALRSDTHIAEASTDGRHGDDQTDK